jgi:glycosyltransferase involved in cell wall biosynthesis
MVKISVVIITFNEERNIARCLDSVKEIADEILVVDSLSTDGTKHICHSFGARFIEHPFQGYIEQKNVALDLAKYDHVLSLDADEALSDELKASIYKVKLRFNGDGFTMNRFTNYCGQWIKHCGWYPDMKLRLFDRTKGRWGGINPHDQFFMDKGSIIEKLKGDLLHYSYHTEEDHHRQIERFTDIAAQAYFEAGKKPTFIKLWMSPAAKFFGDYFIKQGFRDGKAGLKICALSAKATHLKYYKLKRLTHNNI